MRSFLIAIVIVGGLASVALCGSYGWDQGGAVLKDQVTQAFMYGMAAVFTLALHVAGIRMWIQGWRKLGAFVVLAAFLAFVMTAFTGLGGMASRGDRFVAERQDVLDTKADTRGQIDALVAEKKGLMFTRATQATVDAAKLLSDAARLAREQECGKLGENCRKRQDAEATALTALAKAQENKAATDRAVEIDAELKRLRLLKTEGAVGTANPLRDLLATIIGAWADVLTSWQKAAFVVIYDICLIATMIAIEVIGQGSVVLAKSARREEPEPAPRPVAAQPPLKPAPARPQLVINNDEVPAILARLLGPAPGERVEVSVDLNNAYATQCRLEGKKPAPLDQFVDGVKKLCKDAGIKTRTVKGHVYLMEVHLVASMSQVADGNS